MDKEIIILATDHVRPNEPCFGLAELNRILPNEGGGTGLHRVQIIEVIRGDQRWEHTRDMGLADGYAAEEFVIPGHVPVGNGRYDVIETVGRLQGAADDWRAQYGRTERPDPPQDLVKGFEEYAIKRRDA